MSERCRCPACGQELPDDDELRIDPAGIVVRRGRYAVLTRQEHALLEALRTVQPRHRTRQQLLSDLYWEGTDAEEPELKIIDVYVCKLRKKLKPLNVSIDTVWGRGYRLATPAPERGPA